MYKRQIYGRYEFVQKSLHELQLPETDFTTDLFNIHALTAGLNRRVAALGPLELAAGGQLTAYAVPAPLKNRLGGNPLSGQVYLRLMPRRFNPMP